MRLADVSIVDAATGETQPGAAGLDLRVERGGVTVCTSGNGHASDIHRWPWSSIGGLHATTGAETPDGRPATTLEVIVNGWPVQFLVPASELPPQGIRALQSMAPVGHPVALVAEPRSSLGTHPSPAEADPVRFDSESVPQGAGTIQDVSPSDSVRPQRETARSDPSGDGGADPAAVPSPVAVMSARPAPFEGFDPADEIEPVDESDPVGLVDADVPEQSEELPQTAQLDVVPTAADGASPTANGWAPATNAVDLAGGASDPVATEMFAGGTEHPRSRRSVGAVGAGAAALLAVAAVATAFSVTGNHGRSSGHLSRLQVSNGAGIPHLARRHFGNPGSTTSLPAAQASPPTVTTQATGHAGTTGHAGVSTRTNFLPPPASSIGTTAANGGSGGQPTSGRPTRPGGSGPVPPAPTTTQSTSPTTGSTAPPSTTTTSTSTTTTSTTSTTTPSSTTTTPPTTTTTGPSGP